MNSSFITSRPVLLTRQFGSSQMFPFIFKSSDFGGKSTTFSLFAFRYVVVALARWAGALEKTSNAQRGKNPAISRMSRAFCIVVIICSRTLVLKPGALFIRKNSHGIFLGCSQILPHLILFKNA